MANRISHGRAAADEAGKAAFDLASVFVEDLGKARHVVSAADHGEKAVQHAREAARRVVKSKIARTKKTVRKLLNLNQPKRKALTKTSRRKTRATRRK